MRRRFVAAMLCVAGLSAPGPAAAQQPFHVLVEVRKLSHIFTELYGPDGLVVDSLALLPTDALHSAHFNSAFHSEFVQFGTALTSRLVSVPLPSPASGFTYEFDAALGVFSRTTQSFGPILAERAETLGAGRASFGFSFQRFNFDTIEGGSLAKVPAVFTHDDFQLRGGREDIVATLNAIEARINQFTGFLTYGLTNRLDLSVAVPVVGTDVKVTSDATIHRIGTTNPATHFFRTVDGGLGDRRIFTAIGRAGGIGDVTLRLKQTVRRNGNNGVAVGLDIRLPTGDEENLLGTGAAGLQPFVVWSMVRGPVAPHANAGYLWTGSSILAGDPAAGESRDLPDQIAYAAGADFRVNPRFTFAVDVLGRFLIDSPRLFRERFRALDGVSVFPTVGFRRESFNELSGAVGLKYNLAGQVLLDFNLLFALDDNGLRDKVTPLVGLEYGF